MTGIEKLRAQVEGGTTPNIVVPRALMRDILRQIEREAGAARAGGANLAASLGCDNMRPHMEACWDRNRERGRC